jgi:hypothetical protein
MCTGPEKVSCDPNYVTCDQSIRPNIDSVFEYKTPHVHATFKPMGHNYKESYNRATSSDIVISSLTQELASV